MQRSVGASADLRFNSPYLRYWALQKEDYVLSPTGLYEVSYGKEGSKRKGVGKLPTKKSAAGYGQLGGYITSLALGQ